MGASTSTALDAAAMRETCSTCASSSSSSGYQGFVDLFIVISVGLSTLVVLFRVVFRAPTAVVPASTMAATATATAAASTAASTTTRSAASLKQPTASVKERLEAEIRTLLPRRSTYYSMPFFSEQMSKPEFIESILELGDDVLEGWLLVKKGALLRGKNWKKRYVVLDGNGRVKYFPNADAARRNVNIKGSLTVHAVKPADPSELGANTLEIRGTLGGTYYFRTEDDMTARRWLCVLTKRAIQGRVPGRIDAAPLLAGNESESNSAASVAASVEAAVTPASTFAAVAAATASGALKSHKLELMVEDMTYSKEASLRQFYVVVKFKSELHDHTSVPVGQTVPKACDKGVVNWQEQLAWQFHDHMCVECPDCQAVGSMSGTFRGLPDMMIIHVYEIHLRYLTTKIGHVAISLRELFGFVGMKNASMACSWPVISRTDCVLGQLALKVQYGVEAAGGAAVQPFLVSSDTERELLGEYEVHSSITSCVEFFQMFYANGTLNRWQTYYKARGDTEVEIGEWSASKEYGGQIRTVSCRSLTNASIGPASTMTTTTQHVSFADIGQADADKLVVEARVFLHDIPYGDCFTVEQVIVVERVGASLVGKSYLGIPFSKGCMFKSKIISATREGVSHSTRLLFDELNKSIDSGGAASTPTKPFLMSQDDERHPLGDFELHASIRDPAHFFELFYANDTLHRWEGYHKDTGDSEHEVSEWKDSVEFGGQVRSIKFRAVNNSPVGPPSTAATQDQHVTMPTDDDNRLVLETKLELYDVPFGDCFTVETVIIVERDASTGRLIAKARIGVPFSKSTMFKGKITSATRDGVTKSTKLLFDHFRKHLDEAAGGASGAEDADPLASSSRRPIVASSSAEQSQRRSSSGSDSGSRSAESKQRSSSQAQPTSQNGAPRRVMLARLNSTLDGSVALEEIFENQRVSIFGKWGPNHLLPTDRARFTNRNGDVGLSFEQIMLPPNWVWTSPWKIDKSYTECDEEGWSYATDFPRFKSHLARGKSSNKRLGASVRRRRWIRMMAYVPQEGNTSSSTSRSSSPTRTSLSN
ncbi:hypothetical protein PINS_up010732 [Pythium insidiosum]|nr:hypothetical protein PINS_up010732 [Pythium insidiosum]